MHWTCRYCMLRQSTHALNEIGQFESWKLIHIWEKNAKHPQRNAQSNFVHLRPNPLPHVTCKKSGAHMQGTEKSEWRRLQFGIEGRLSLPKGNVKFDPRSTSSSTCRYAMRPGAAEATGHCVAGAINGVCCHLEQMRVEWTLKESMGVNGTRRLKQMHYLTNTRQLPVL